LFSLNLIQYNLITSYIFFIMIIKLPDKFHFYRAITLCLLLAASVTLLTKCEKENSKPRSYPRIKTLPVTNISQNGAEVSADLYSLGTEPIIDHGFVYGTSDPAITYSDKILLGTTDSTGIFRGRISSALRSKIKYYVKPFVQTSKHVVYGVTTEFMSQGSDGPVIFGFEPKAATWFDTLKITGQNFSWLVNTNIVKLNQASCDVIEATSTSLKVLVSKDLVNLKSLLSVELAGNITTDTKDTFNLVIPVVSGFSPKQARWGDTITVTGKDFPALKFDMQASATLGGFSCPIVLKKNDQVKFLVPNELNASSNTLIVKIQNQNYTLPDKFNLLPPYISSISPKVGTWGTQVTLKGKFNSSASRNTINIGGINAPLVSSTRDSVKVNIPSNLGTPSNVFVNISFPFTISSPDTFKLYAPVIESITPLTGTSGSIVSITGKYLKYSVLNPVVKFGNQAASIRGSSSIQIDCTVPANLSNGPVNVSVTVASQTTVAPMVYNLHNPAISGFSPLSASAGDVVTIQGTDLLNGGTFAPDVYFSGTPSDIFATTVSAASDKIIVTVPAGLDSIPKRIRLFYRSISLNVYSTSQFVLNAPSIISVTGSVLTAGQDISVSGTGFDPVAANNKVLWGKYPLIVKSATPNTLVATVTSNLPSGFNQISIISGGYKRTYPIIFESRSAWTEIPVPGTLAWTSTIGSSGGIGFSLNGTGYMIDPKGQMISLNPLTREMTSLGLHQEFSNSQGFAKMILNDTLYAVGYNVSQLDGLFRYDPSLNSWIRLANAPSNYPNGVGFSLNGKLYYGLTIIADNYSLTNLFWVYDRPSKSWVSKQPFPSFSYSRAVASFTIGNRGYVLFKDRVFCEYNPDNDTWTKLASFPAPRTDLSGMVYFTMNSIGYVGLGGLYYNSVVYNDLWSFDPVANSWTQSAIIPISGRYNAISFVINNKAYIGFGAYNSTNLRDFYEYDPNIISK
jgi:hypothetical protein